MKRYYALNNDYEFVEYESTSAAIDSGNWIIIMITDFKNASEKTSNDFSFISKGDRQESNEIKINNWKASLESYTGNNYGYYSRFRFVAPDGRLRPSGSHQSKTFSNIINNIKKFIEASQFNNWEQYDTYIENIELKNKIEVLEEKIKEDEEEIKLLKSRIDKLEE